MVRSNHEQPYRARALKLFPWICTHCGREFDGKKLSQLTVHHNNPSDGSDWEFLYLYCHDNEHQRDQAGAGLDDSPLNRESERPFTPFARLANLLRRNTAA